MIGTMIGNVFLGSLRMTAVIGRFILSNFTFIFTPLALYGLMNFATIIGS